MKNVSLTVPQRAILISVANDQKCGIDVLRKWLKIMDVLEITEQERKDAGMVEQGGLLRWTQADAELPKKIEIEDDHFKMIVSAINNKNDWPVNRAIDGLFEAFKKKPEGENTAIDSSE